jgi:hypothetical protein
MGSKKDAMWDEFHEPYVPDGSKATKVVCRNCSEVVGAAATRLRSHISACSKHARSIGQLNLGFTAPPRKKTKTATSSSGDPSTAKTAKHNGNIMADAHHFRTLPLDVRATLDLSSADVDKMHTLVCHHFKTIFSSEHALAFRTDLLFDDLRDNLAKLHRDAFLNLGDLTILQQCKNAIKRMAAADVLLNRTMQSEFGLYTIRVKDDDDDFADVFSMP